MAGTPDKGRFSTGIGEDLIEEAVRAGEKRTGTETSAEAEPGAPVDLAPEAGSPAAEAAPAEDGGTKKELEELRIQLEFSQAKGRELMEKIKETHDKMLRAVADLENFKRRAQKE